MKFIIDVEEFYLEEGELKAELLSQIKHEVVSQIRVHLKEQIDREVSAKIKEDVSATLKDRIAALVDVVIEKELITSRFDNSKKISLKDWINEEFLRNHTGKADSITTHIERQGKAFADQMKNRYDLSFAAQLVAKMNENGMLREDVAKKLLEQPE